jgi:hypothetical protein
MFGLTVAFGMVTRGEMQIHIESFAEGLEEVGNGFRSSVQCHMTWDTVLLLRSVPEIYS